MEPTAFVQALRASTADLVSGLDAEQWRDTDVAAPSLCAGWTRGDVLTHLARNADGITSTLSGALRGEMVLRYPGGVAARDAGIAAGAGRPLTELVADVRDSADRLDRVLAAVADGDGWELPTEHELPASHWPARRWREVEIHRVDLAGSYGPQQWPPALVGWLLPEAAESLPDRVSSPVRVVVEADGSLGPDRAGASWTAGSGLAGDAAGGAPVTEVRGPDWAVLAWLLGRTTEPVRAALSATPELAAWG